MAISSVRRCSLSQRFPVRGNILKLILKLCAPLLLVALLIPGVASAQAVGANDEFSGDQQSALDSCMGLAYLINNCNTNGTIQGASCSGCGMAGTVPGTASCQATERAYTSSRPGYCFTLHATSATAFVYPTTPCPAGTTFLGSGTGDCASASLVGAADASARYAGRGGLSEMDVAGGVGTQGSFRTLGAINVRTGGAFWQEQDFEGGDGVPSLTRYYNSMVLDDRAGMGFGWTHSQFRRLWFRMRGEVRVMRPDGATIKFVAGEDGQPYDTEPGVDLRLERNSDGTFRLTLRDGTTEDYSANGLVTKISEPSGLATTYTYVNAYGKLSTVRGPFGHTMTFTWSSTAATSSLKSITLPSGRVLTLTVGGRFNLDAVANGDATSKHYTYAPGPTKSIHHLMQVLDERGIGVMSFDYTNGGDVIEAKGPAGFDWVKRTGTNPIVITKVGVGAEYQTVSAVGSTARVTRREYDPPNVLRGLPSPRTAYSNSSFDAQTWRQVSESDGNGRTATASYDAAGRIQELVRAAASPAEASIQYTYTADWTGLPTLITRPSTRVGARQATSFGFADSRFPTLPTSMVTSGFRADGTPVSSALTIGYGATGRPESVDGPRTDVSDTATVTYWGCTTGGKCGQVASVRNALGQTTTYDDYDAGGLLKQTTSPAGVVTRYGYDTRGRIASVVATGAGLSSSWSAGYDAAERMTQVTDWDGAAWTLGHDDASNLTSARDATGYTRVFAYSPARQVTSSQLLDPSGQVVVAGGSTYDAMGNELTSSSAVGSVLRSFDTSGNVIAWRDPKGNPVASNQFDAANRLSSSVARDGGVTTVNYDPNNAATSVQTPNGATWGFEVDDLGNTLRESSPDKGTTTRGFDDAGNVVWKVDGRGVRSTYGYDALNRLTNVGYDGSPEENVAYGYDTCVSGAGALCSVTDGAGQRSFGFDGLGRPANQTWSAGGRSFNTAFTWTPGGRLASMTYPSGRVVTYARHVLGRVTAITSGTQTLLSGRSYRGDMVAGQTMGNGVAETRAYDTDGRLRNWTIGSTVLSFQLDANGNVVGSTVGGNAASYSYDAEDRMTSELGGSFSYDLNGNRISDGVGSYQYAAGSDRMIASPMGSIQFDTGGFITSTWSGWTFTYGAAGRLKQAANGTTAATYSFRGDGLRASKTAGGTTTYFHYDVLDHLIAESDSAGNIVKEYVWDDDSPVAQIASGQTLFLHTDELGTPRLATDSAQAPAWQWFERPFGTGPPYGTATVNLRMPGQYFDAETGLHHNRFRTYDPNSGRYLEADPISLAGGLNPYAYVGNNPLAASDPDGLILWTVFNIFMSIHDIHDLFRMGMAEWAETGALRATLREGAELAASQLIPGGPVFRRLSKAGKLVEGAAAKFHRNSLSYVGETHVYRIKGPAGSTYKIGESARGLNAQGASIRAEQQARSLTRETGDVYTTEIRRTFADKASAREYETRVIERFRRIFGDDKLPGNLTNR